MKDCQAVQYLCVMASSLIFSSLQGHVLGSLRCRSEKQMIAPDTPPVCLALHYVPVVQFHRAIYRKEPSRYDESRELDQGEQEHILQRSPPRRVQRHVHPTPRCRPTPLLKFRLRASEKVDQGETRRASEEITLVFKKRVGREMCADSEKEDGKVQEGGTRGTRAFGRRGPSRRGGGDGDGDGGAGREGNGREWDGGPVLGQDRRRGTVVRHLHTIIRGARRGPLVLVFIRGGCWRPEARDESTEVPC